MDKEVKKYLNDGYILENNVQCKKELKIVVDNIKESTLSIICRKEIFTPELTQYEIHNGIILKFENLFSMSIKPEFDLFHYTLKDYVEYISK